MSFDSDLQVSVTLDANPPSSAGFGVPLVAASALNVGFAERLRFYESPADAADDADLTSNIINAVQAAFAQTPRPARVAVGRMDGLAGLVEDITVNAIGGDAQVFTINVTLNGVAQPAITYAKDPADLTPDAIIDGLKAAFDLAGFPASTQDNGDSFRITWANWYDVVTTTVTHDTTPANISRAEVSAAVTVEEELAAINDASSDWYGLVLESREMNAQFAAASWGAANDKFVVVQSKDAGIINTAYDEVAPDDIAELLKASSVAALVVWHDDDLEWIDMGALASRLAVNPDRATTVWDKVPVVGYVANKLTATEMSNLKSKSANVFDFFLRRPVFGPGTVATGTFADLIVTRDWIKARITEAIADLLLAAPASGTKIPFDMRGFQRFGEAVEELLAQGVRVGHFRDGTAVVNLPDLDEISEADEAARRYAFTWGAQPAGAVQGVTVGGTVSIDFDGASL